jgi:hypothetical protein
MPILQDLEVFYSNVAQTGVGVPRILTSEFKSGLVNQMMPPLPKVGKIKNDMVGGLTGQGRKSRNNYWLPRDIPLSGQLNTEDAADFAKRCFGGSVTDTLVATGVYDHTVSLQTKAQQYTPFLFTLGFLLSGYDFLHADCAVDTFEINFGGDGVPQFSAGVKNTGHSFTRMRDLGTPLVPATPPAYHIMHPAGVNAMFNDGTLRDLGALGRLVSGRCGINQQIKTKPRPGYDTFRTVGDRTTGALIRIIERGQRVYNPSVKLIMDDAMQEWTDSINNTDVTNLKYFFGGDPIGATIYSHEFEITYPLSTLDVDTDTEGEDGATTLTFDTDRDDAVGGIATLRVRNGNATLV